MVPAGISPPISHVRTPRRCLITGKIEAPFLCGTDKQQPNGPMTVRLLLCGGKHKCRPPRRLFCLPCGSLHPRAHLQPSSFHTVASARARPSRAPRKRPSLFPTRENPAALVSGCPPPPEKQLSMRTARQILFMRPCRPPPVPPLPSLPEASIRGRTYDPRLFMRPRLSSARPSRAIPRAPL